MFAVGKIRIIQTADLPKRFDSLVRFWDLAATENAGDYTVGVLVGKIRDKTTGEDRFTVLDVHRGQWAGDRTIEEMVVTSNLDRARYGEAVRVGIERQPGGAGKWATEQFLKRLRQFRVFSVAPNGSKVVRAEPLANAIGFGEVSSVDGPWLPTLLDEMEGFPGGRHDDQVDSLSGSFNALAGAESSESKGMVLPKLTSTRDPSSWDIPKCLTPGCNRPAFGIGNSVGYCCSHCFEASEWQETCETHDCSCALEFTKWWAKNSPNDSDKRTNSTFRFRR